MSLLFLVSFIWALSFGLIKGQLGGIDATAVATIRLALALIVFLPYFRWRGIVPTNAARLALIGAVQFGIMYVLYQNSYAYLPAYAIVLFTLTTPLYLAIVDALVERRLLGRYLSAAGLALVGAAAVWYRQPVRGEYLKGFLLVQASNLCFAGGQIAWRRERSKMPENASDAALFALPYAGALLTCALASCFFTDWAMVRISISQWGVLLYLGVISSGVCFFWWNIGATRVNAGTLAAFNNAKVPLGIACSLLLFGEHADVLRLLGGGALIVLAVWVAETGKAKRAT